VPTYGVRETLMDWATYNGPSGDGSRLEAFVEQDLEYSRFQIHLRSAVWAMRNTKSCRTGGRSCIRISVRDVKARA
jgi:hypothetical protein